MIKELFGYIFSWKSNNMLGNVVNYLATKGIKISTQNEWLVECYNCCAENDPHVTIFLPKYEV